MQDGSFLPVLHLPLANLSGGSASFSLSNVDSYADLYKAIPIDNPYFLLFWAAAIVYFQRRLYRRIVTPEHLKIQFFLPDYWAAILALLPSFFLLEDVRNGNVLNVRQAGMFLLTFVSTLAGIRAWLILALPRKGAPLPSHASHFISVLSGGYIGLFSVFLLSFAFTIVQALFWVAYAFCWLCVEMPPLIAISALCLAIFWRAYRLLF